MQDENLMAESIYGKYIITELKAPETTPEAAAQYAEFATRVLRMDGSIIPGSFQMSCSWYHHPNTSPSNQLDPHVHDCDEILGFFGADSEVPHDLGGEVEFWLEGEQHIITKSCLIFIPKGMKHCPLVVRRVDRPIFHFGILDAAQYGRQFTATKE
jgi:hypothetical protein